ncbi:MAG: phosphatase PAP2 family protein [Candidatus Eiseniibacteriota bacterium]
MNVALARGLCVMAWLTIFPPLDSLDQRLQSGVQAGRRPALEQPMHFLSHACNGTTLCAGLLAIAIFDPIAGVETAKTALLVLAPTNAAVEVIKRATDRTRPDGEHKRSNASFPSSHAANMFALAVVLGRRWRRALPGALLLAAAVAYSRVYLNRHYLSDVLAGAVLGTSIAIVVARWRAMRVAEKAPASPSRATSGA